MEKNRKRRHYRVVDINKNTRLLNTLYFRQDEWMKLVINKIPDSKTNEDDKDVKWIDELEIMRVFDKHFVDIACKYDVESKMKFSNYYLQQLYWIYKKQIRK